MPKLYYQGHGSYRLTTNDGRVVYVDPYAGDGYDVTADFILVTHQHHDHNRTGLVAKKTGCVIITNEEALEGGKHNSFDLGGGLTVEAVEASNRNHSPNECVGYVVGLDGVTLYCAGDTSRTEQMGELKARGLDYALFPMDGVYNMGLEEAAECARVVGAKRNIPIHMKPGALFDRGKSDQWDAPNKLVIEPGQEIELQA
ncbi:MAG: MBL fold metallo-hydrolase [Oscillospiraceae bacterium]|jgi:L-ascorbate metabolism protein UlaG (beta-lactamase superfamily)|nr:MBL fold metallo-hydrolase [Oscillospiraceae bacterium]